MRLLCQLVTPHYVAFDPFRTLGLNRVRYIKPERFYHQIDQITASRAVLFPEYWQIPALVFGLNKPVFPSLASYMIGHDKIHTTRCFKAVALANIPVTLIESNNRSNADEIWAQMALPFVAKIPRSSMGEGVFLIESRADWNVYCQRSEVLYAQEYLPIDRDLRIVWVGNTIVGGYWRLQSGNGFHNNISRGGTLDHSPIPMAALALVEKLARTTGIDYGGFDVAMVGDHPYLIEYNRLFGNQGLQGKEQEIAGYIQRHIDQQWGDHDPEQPNSPTVPEVA